MIWTYLDPCQKGCHKFDISDCGVNDITDSKILGLVNPRAVLQSRSLNWLRGFFQLRFQ